MAYNPQAYLQSLVDQGMSPKDMALKMAQYESLKGEDPWAYPSKAPEYTPGYDPKTMSFWEAIKGRIEGIKPDTRGIQAYREEALRKGPSRWAGMAGEQQAMEALQAKSGAAKGAAGQMAQAQNMLAMRGGIDSGARERLAQKGMENYLSMSQDINKGKAQNLMQIGLNDEQNRISQLGALPGMEVQALQPQMDLLKLEGQARQFDTTAQMEEAKRRSMFDLERYNTQMAGWGAGQQAQATENAGKK